MKVVRYPREPRPDQRALVEHFGFEVVVDLKAPVLCAACVGRANAKLGRGSPVRGRKK